jgi:hypothetical protein
MKPSDFFLENIIYMMLLADTGWMLLQFRVTKGIDAKNNNVSFFRVYKYTNSFAQKEGIEIP